MLPAQDTNQHLRVWHVYTYAEYTLGTNCMEILSELLLRSILQADVVVNP